MGSPHDVTGGLNCGTCGEPAQVLVNGDCFPCADRRRSKVQVEGAEQELGLSGPEAVRLCIANWRQGYEVGFETGFEEALREVLRLADRHLPLGGPMSATLATVGSLLEEARTGRGGAS